MTDDTESAYASATNDSDSEMEEHEGRIMDIRQMEHHVVGFNYPRGLSDESEDDLRSLFNDDLLMAENEELHWERIAMENGLQLKDALDENRKLRSALNYLNKENTQNQKIILVQKQLLKKKDRLLKKKAKKMPKFLNWNCVEDILPTNDNGVIGTKRFLHKNLTTFRVKL